MKAKKAPPKSTEKKKEVLKHLKGDMKESKESIREDKKLAKTMKKKGC